MAAIILNPNSIYRNSQANFILNKDALYAFTRSISAVNDSIYGMQPTKEQLLSGFDLSDIFAVNPLSSNNSLCANVYVLDNSVNALKFFSSRPFVVLSSITELDKKAQNPFAVYLTPIEDSENCYEWIYIMPSVPEVSDWDLMLSAYSAWEADKEGFRLSSFGGKWELIGSTSFTDEEISALYNDIKSTIDEEVSALNSKIDTEASERKEADIQIIAEVDSKLSSLDEKLSVIEEISSVYETKDDAADKLIEAKTYTDNTVSSIREDIEEEIDNVVDGFNNFISDEYEVFKDFVENDLVTDLSNASKNYTDEVSSNLSTAFDLSSYAKLSDVPEIPTDLSAFTNSPGYLTAHQSLSDYYTKSEADSTFLTAHQDLTDYATKDYVQSEISDFITEDALADLATKDDVQKVEDKLSDYAQLSDIPEVPTDLSAFTNSPNYVTKSEVESRISGFALSTTVADAYAVSVVQDGLTYTVKQGLDTVGTITVVEDRFITSAEFEGTILVLHTNTGEIVSTDLSGLAEQYYGDSGEETRISVCVENNRISAVLLDSYFKLSDANEMSTDILNGISNIVNPKLEEIAECVSAEVEKVDEISGKISALVSKEDIRNAIESQLSDYEQWLTETPPSISVMVDWNRALHTTLKNLI